MAEIDHHLCWQACFVNVKRNIRCYRCNLFYMLNKIVEWWGKVTRITPNSTDVELLAQ